jgi:capsular polysaccharide biosynthesis protein
MAVALIAGFLLGSVYTALGGKSYLSAASVLVNPTPTLPGQTTAVNPANGRTSGAVNLDTEGQLVKSTNVLNAAVQSLNNGTSVAGIRSRLDVVVPPNTTILRISCTGGSARSAQSCASAVARAYLANREATLKTLIATTITATKAQLDVVKAALLQDATDIQNAASGTIAKNAAFARQTSDLTDRNSLNSDLNELASAFTSPGTIVSQPAPGVASKVSLITGPIAGLILGIIAGIIAVVVRERRDKFVRNVDDLLRYGVPLIASSEPKRVKDATAASERAARTRFEQRIASVVAGAFDDDGGVIYIAGVSAGQSPDRIARRLASTLASVGHSVELVRADDVAGRPTAMPGIAGSPRSVPAVAAPLFESRETNEGSALGWPSTSYGDSVAADVPVEAPIDTTPQLIDDSFATDPAPMSIPQLIADSRRHAQFVIIEGEPAATDAQAYILTGLSDAAVLVVDPQVTTRQDLDEVVDQISVTGSELLGAVLWRQSRKPRADVAATPARPADAAR